MLTIGKLAQESGVGVETVRFYERKGLLKQPKKTVGSGFRVYRDDDIAAIRFIKRAQELGFTLVEVKGLLALNANPKAKCEDVANRAAEKLGEVEEKIRDLKRVKKALQELQTVCEKSRDAVACYRITDCFENGCC